MGLRISIEINSVGRMCELLRRSPGAIEAAARQIGIEPALVLNGIRHYDGDQLELLMKHFREVSR